MDSRASDDYVRRRYKCECGARWTTAEVFVHDEAKQQHFAVQKALAQQTKDKALAICDRITEAIRREFL
jgi:hypothetical protein